MTRLRLRERFFAPTPALIFAIIFLGSSPAQENPSTMDLKAMITEALANNAGISAAKINVEAVETGRTVASRQRFPRLDLFATYEGFPVEDKLLLRRHMDLPTPPFTQPEMVDFFQDQFNTNIFNSGINVKLPLYTGGRIGAGIELQEAMSDQAGFNLESKTNDLVFAVVRAYYMTLQLQKVVEANEKAVESLKESKRIVEKLLDVGKARNVDLFRINTKLADIQQNLIKAQFNLERTHGLLNSVMGRHVTDELQVTGVLHYSPTDFSLQKSIDQALRSNPEYLSTERQLIAQAQKVRIAKSARLPNLSLMASYRGAYGNISPDFRDDAAVVVNLSVPLFSGGVIRSKVEREKLILKKIEAKRSALKQKLSQEVYSAYLGIVEAGKQIEVAEIAILEAEESLRIEKQTLKQGKGVVKDVLDAEVDHVKTEVKYYRALSDHNVAVMALKKTTGTIDKELD